VVACGQFPMPDFASFAIAMILVDVHSSHEEYGNSVIVIGYKVQMFLKKFNDYQHNENQHNCG
jgi:hypothetical protein